MDRTQLGLSALTGWREKVADGVAGPVAGRAPLSEDQVRALVGVALFALSTYYVASTAARMAKVARG
jgi:hypothetical protein